MIISRTPLRISFVGGGSDLPDYYQNNGGAVVSMAINKYIYLSLHPYFYGNKYFLKYSNNELVDSLDQIRHRIIKAVLSDYKINQIDFNSSADVPSGTGLGSSSSFTCGLTTLCNAYTGKYMNQEDVAQYACQIEIQRLESPIGKQDQYAAAYGGLNYIQFNQDDSVSIEKIYLDKNRRNYLKKNLLAFFTGGTRSTNEILETQKNSIIKNTNTNDILKKMVDLAEDLKRELYNGNIDLMGEILHTNWQYKKEIANKISNDRINDLYELGLKNGAIGGKLLGAGGGGFLLFYAKEYHHSTLKKAMAEQGLIELDFDFDFKGSTIIYYDQ